MSMAQDLENTQREVSSLREMLVTIQESLGKALERLDGLNENMRQVGDAAVAHDSDVGGTLDRVTRLHSEQGRTLDEAKARSQPSLQKVLGQATELHAQESRLVDAAREARGNQRQDIFQVLEQLQQLATSQRAILRDELGKFEAQGLRNLLDRLDDLGRRQSEILEKTLANRQVPPPS